MGSLVLLLIGLGIFFLAFNTKDEIHRITAMVSGTISLVWGLALAPLAFQLVVEIVSVLAAFSVCMRCLGCGLKND
jgi:membrane protein implicated in regulation of membrane protease activity